MKAAMILAAGALALLVACREGQGKSAQGPCDHTILIQEFPWLFAATIADDTRTGGGERLAAGTPVVVSPGEGGEMCAQTAGGEGGWVGLDVIQTADPLPEVPETWTGAWVMGKARIEAAPAGEGLRLVGRYDGAEPAFDFETPNAVNGLAYSEGGCGLSMARLGAFLVAVDNRLCTPEGGTFTGIYQREG